MKKGLLLTVISALFTFISFSQANKFWTAHTGAPGTITTDKAVKRLSFPKEYRLFDLDLSSLRKELFQVADNREKHSTVISLPNADGGIEEFEVTEASNFVPALQAQFPEIRAFSGKGITDKYATLKLSISPQGIQTMVFRTEKENEFIEAYSADHTVYAAFRSYRTAGALPWSCTTEEQQTYSGISNRIEGSNFTGSSSGELKTMRLAQSCNAEYSNYFGATSAANVGLVLAAFNATLTRCNGCYEKDLALHLNLIANTTSVIYYDAATDPYTTMANWNNQLQATLTATIGEANYDIGHMFGASGGGGNAGCIGCVCNDGTKGRGITSPADGIPQGDNFDIDYVVHEVGHQLGGNHTFSHSLEGSGVNKEVGAGITIMGYAGITAYDPAPHSIAYYHQASIQQIQNNLATKTCPITTNITSTNATPVVNAVSNYIIPITTPFALTGSATDANPGDALTYSWEQNDNATTSGANSPANPTKATGPNWLSFSPTTSPVRTCPQLSTILAGLSVTPRLPGGDLVCNIEALSSVARTLNFRLTVRDNSPYSSTVPVKVGQTSFADMTVTVSAAVGPFLISSQNSAVTYAGGSTQTVTWDVAGTTGAPTNTANVKILWSTDGGLTFPTVLAASTVNDGTETFVVPSVATTTGRIKVEAIGNIYFDINNASITVSAPTNDFTFGTSATSTSTCPANNPTVTIPTTVVGTFTTPINLAATAGVPAGTTVTFAPNPLTPGNSAVATLNNASTLAAGTYTITVTGTAGATVHTTTITYVINPGAAPVINTQPTAQSACASGAATFTVSSPTAGVTYQWQVSTTGVGGTYVNVSTGTGGTTNSYNTGATTSAMNGYAYHVVISTQCGSVTSNNVLLTVNSAASITTQPTNQSACTGNTATFTVVAAGTGATYQWQSAPALAGPYTNVSTGTGGTTNTYTTAAVTGATDGFYHVIVTTTTCPNTVTSNNVTLTISTTTAIGTQPTAQTVCAPTAATFAVVAAGTGNTYQWQVSTTGIAGTYSNVTTGTGGTTNSYNTGATAVAMNGNYYHVVITGACNTVTSNNVLLTVNTAAAITTAPTAQTVCNGTSATFTVAATGTGAAYQWQSGPSAGGPFTNVSTGTGGNTNSYTTAATTPGMSGTYYQVVVTTVTCPGTATSTPVSLTVNTVATIGTQPTAQSACVPATATFSVAATGTGLGYQWQVSTTGIGGPYTNVTTGTGGNTNTYTTAPVTVAMNGNYYHVLVSSTCSPGSPITSNNVQLSVNNPVSITQNPVDLRGCVGENYTFNVTANPSTGVSYQWEVSTNGGGLYTAIPGAQSSTYTITNAQIGLNGNLYRVVVSGGVCGQATTPGALLTLGYRPTVVLTAAHATTLNPSIVSGLYTTVSPVGNYVYTWTKNGALIPNTLATTSLPITVDNFGTYQVSVTNVTTGCSASSNIITIDSSVSQHLFIYPNPVSSRMQVRFYSSNPAARAMMLNVYDSKGARVIVQEYKAVTGTYGRMDVDMSKQVPGVYMVEIRDANGKQLASAPVMKGL